MTAAILNFDNRQAPVVEQGADFRFTFTYTDSLDTVIDLINYTIRMQVRTNYQKSLIVEFTTENGNISVDSNSEVTLQLTNEETTNLAPGKYIYDMEIIDSEGFVEKLLKGSFIVEAEVTI